MVVEDEEMLRNLSCRFLESQGYVVLQASNGEEALSLYERHQGPIDLLLTDVGMPILDGGQLYCRLRVVQPDLKVLFMSGYTDDAVIRPGILEAETNFIEKPCTFAAMAITIRDIFDRL
jgi:two-component system cell cycle sensor histidine kinase/response regulator CckA